jgi:hypothetical protein
MVCVLYLWLLFLINIYKKTLKTEFRQAAKLSM